MWHTGCWLTISVLIVRAVDIHIWCALGALPMEAKLPEDEADH
jgi:hypothetical protein